MRPQADSEKSMEAVQDVNIGNLLIVLSLMKLRNRPVSAFYRVPRPGLEPGTSASSAQRSPRLSYLGTSRANADIVYLTFASDAHNMVNHRKRFRLLA